MKFIPTALFAIAMYTSAYAQSSLDFLPIHPNPDLPANPNQQRTLDEVIVSSCSDMCRKCSLGICSACRGGYQLIGNQCVLPTELKGLIVKRYGRYQVFNIDYRRNNTPIEAIGIIFALLIFGATTSFMLKKSSIFSCQKQPAECMPNISNMSQSQAQQQPQQAKTSDVKKESGKGPEDKVEKPEDLDKSLDVKEDKEGENKKVTTGKESRSDIEENTHQEIDKNSDEDRSPPAKDINIVINVEGLPNEKAGKIRRTLSRQDNAETKLPGIVIHTVDQEGTINEKQSKQKAEKDQTEQEDEEIDEDKNGSRVEDHEEDGKDEKDVSALQEQFNRSEGKSAESEDGEPAEEQEGVEAPQAHRDREVSKEQLQAHQIEEAAGNKEEQPRRPSTKKNDESDHEKIKKPGKDVGSEVVFEESLDHSNVGAGNRNAGKTNNTQDIVLTLNEFLDKSAEKPHDTEDANASAYGFLAAVTRRDAN